MMSGAHWEACLRILGLGSFVLLGLLGCGGNNGGGDNAAATARLGLELTAASQPSAVRLPGATTPASPQQVIPGNPRFISRLDVAVTAPEMTPVTASFPGLTEGDQETLRVELAVPRGDNRRIVVTAFNEAGALIFAGAAENVSILDEAATVSITMGLETDPMPAMSADLTRQVFRFADGTAFGIAAALGEVELVFETLPNQTTVFGLATPDAAASGTVALADCDLTVLTSTFPAGQGPQAGEVIDLTTCDVDAIDGRFVTANSATGAEAISVPPTASANSAPTVSSSAVVAGSSPDVSIGPNTSGTTALTVSDPDSGQTLSFVITTPPANGAATIDSATGFLMYTPEHGFTGSDSVTVTATDNGVPPLLGQTTVNIEVCNNVLPTPSVTPAITTNEDASGSTQFQILTGRPNVLTFDVTQPTSGTAVVETPDTDTTRVTYTPAAGFTGSDNVLFTLISTFTDGGCPPEERATFDIPVTVNPGMTTALADLMVSKTALPDPIEVGQLLTYNLTVANNGPATATGVVLTDSLPQGVVFEAANAPTGTTCSAVSGVVTCELGNMAPNAVLAVAIQVVAPSQAGTINNTANVAANEPDPDTANNTATISTTVELPPPVQADLTLLNVATPDPVVAGQELLYSITATNAGPGTATGVMLTDPLPTEVTFVSLAFSTGAICNENAGTVTCDFGNLASGGSANVNIRVTAPPVPGTVVNTATVTANEPDPDATNNTATRSTVVTLSPVQRQLLYPGPVFPVVGIPVRVEVAFLNGDDFIDIATAGIDGATGTSTVSIILGQGDGTFSTPQSFMISGSLPNDLVVADIDADGTLDIVTVAITSGGLNEISVLLGQGDGSFTPGTTTPVGTAPSTFVEAIAVSNFGGGSSPDLVTANTDSDNLSIFLGQGNGSFTPGATVASMDPQAVVAIDLDGDGIVDLSVANGVSDTISILLGQGNGTFEPVQSVPLGGGQSPTALAIIDLNNDGNLDGVTANGASNDVSVLLGQGSGAFAPAQTFAVGAAPADLLVLDVNADNNLDLLTTNPDSSDVSVLLGQGDGTFNPAQAVITNEAFDAFFGSFAAADVNGDNAPDLVFPSIFSSLQGGGALVLFGRGDGGFATRQVFPTGLSPADVAIADLNADNVPDLVTANFDANTISVLLGVDLTFPSMQEFPTGESPGDLVIADLNNDGIPDVVTANAGATGAGLSVLIGQGNGAFAAPQAITTGEATTGVEVADVNGDGNADLLAGNDASGNVLVVLGQSGGTFAAPQIVTNVGPGNLAAGAVADVDGDNILDLVLADATSGGIVVLAGQGDGTFAAPQLVVPNIFTPFPSIAVADVNADGVSDIVTTNFSATLVVALGQGGGMFAAAQTFQANTFLGPLVVVDVNGDGALDVVSAGIFSVVVLLGQGNGAFTVPQAYAAGLATTSVAVADVNGDGQPDIVLSDEDNNTVSILLHE